MHFEETKTTELCFDDGVKIGFDIEAMLSLYLWSSGIVWNKSSVIRLGLILTKPVMLKNASVDIYDDAPYSTIDRVYILPVYEHDSVLFVLGQGEAHRYLVSREDVYNYARRFVCDVLSEDLYIPNSIEPFSATLVDGEYTKQHWETGKEIDGVKVVLSLNNHYFSFGRREDKPEAEVYSLVSHQLFFGNKNLERPEGVKYLGLSNPVFLGSWNREYRLEQIKFRLPTNDLLLG